MNTFAPKSIYSGNATEITLHAAALIIAEAYRAVADHKRFSLVLAGGNSPRLLYAQLAQGVSTAVLEHYALPLPESSFVNKQTLHPLPQNTWFFQGDERCVPIGHPDSNFRMITESLLPKSAIPEDHFFRMAAENSDTELAAREYEAAIRDFFSSANPLEGQNFPVFDLIVLGLGEDGHTASLFSENTEALQETKRWVVAVNASQAKPPGKRLTLTLPLINHARNVLFFTTGSSKSKLAKKIFLEQEKSVPASLVTPKNGTVFWFTTSKSSPPTPAPGNEPDTIPEVELQPHP
ncbi:MAG: 6-phosphogluconolactonase [Chlorobiaceae bacterium]|jgi:6-phosphogluconolactonase